MQKKSLVISIVVAQFILIVCLAVFALLKMVEADKLREEAQDAHENAITQKKQAEFFLKELLKYQEKEIK